MRYIWIDYLCVVQGDEEALSKISDIYRSAIVTIVASGTISKINESDDFRFDGPVLEQPFSIFLDWSRPTAAKSFSDHLVGPKIFHGPLAMQNAIRLVFTLEDMDRLHGAETVQPEVAIPEARFDEASREIVQGVHHVEAGKNLEALAFFMKARELVSTFQTLNLKSWRLHALASANIALVYQMKHLPAIALDIAEASLVVHRSLPKEECNSTFE